MLVQGKTILCGFTSCGNTSEKLQIPPTFLQAGLQLFMFQEFLSEVGEGFFPHCIYSRFFCSRRHFCLVPVVTVASPSAQKENSWRSLAEPVRLGWLSQIPSKTQEHGRKILADTQSWSTSKIRERSIYPSINQELLQNWQNEQDLCNSTHSGLIWAIPLWRTEGPFRNCNGWQI